MKLVELVKESLEKTNCSDWEVTILSQQRRISKIFIEELDFEIAVSANERLAWVIDFEEEFSGLDMKALFGYIEERETIQFNADQQEELKSQVDLAKKLFPAVDLNLHEKVINHVRALPEQLYCENDIDYFRRCLRLNESL